MAIVMMVSAEHKDDPNVRTVTDYPGHAVTDWRHHFDCPHARVRPEVKHDDCPARCGFMSPLYMRTSHVGLVLSTGERNGYDDSDFFATVWNPATGRTEQIEYASTRGWTYPNGAAVDATPEVRALYDAWVAERAVAARARREAREALVPAVGRTVRVTKGRKVPIGTTGRVGWFGPDRFARAIHSSMADTLDQVTYGAFRVGIDTPSGRVFTNASNVTVEAGDATPTVA